MDMVTEIPDGFQMPDIFFGLLFKTEIDDLMDVLQRFIQCLPLRITPLKKRALHHIEAIFIFFNKNREIDLIGSFHAVLIVVSTPQVIKKLLVVGGNCLSYSHLPDDPRDRRRRVALPEDI